MSNIVVPELGESVVEARIAKWLKKPGDSVAVGEAVVELETEKIDLEVSAEKSGVIASIARQEGEDVKIGELLAVVDESGAAAGAPAPPAPAESKPKGAPPAAQRTANGAPVIASDDRRSGGDADRRRKNCRREPVPSSAKTTSCRASRSCATTSSSRNPGWPRLSASSSA